MSNKTGNPKQQQKANSKKYYGKRNKSRKSREEEKAPEGYKKTEGTNAITWHTPDIDLLRRASDMSWAYQTGELIETMRCLGKSLRNDNVTDFKAAQTGILCIREMVTVGGMGYINHNIVNYPGVNPTYNAANTLLTEMRSRARIRNTYDAPDVFMLNVAMADIYAGITLAKRLAATIKMFTYQNHYLPEQLIKLQGFDYDWFKKNQFTFITRLNVLISEVNKIYVPNRMHLFELINERYSNYFTEGESIKDQIYFFTPAFLSKIVYNPSDDYAATVRPTLIMPGKCIVANESINEIQYNATTFLTGDDLLRALQEMINAVIEHDAVADITGDMENCFGSENRFLLTQCESEAIAVPVFDEEILETIHNMSWSRLVVDAFHNYHGTVLGNEELAVYPKQFTTQQVASNNAIGAYDWFEWGADSVTEKNKSYLHSEASFRILDVHKDPGPEKTFAITRLRNYPMYINANGTNIGSRIHFSSDLICDVVYAYFNLEGGQNVWHHTSMYQMQFADAGACETAARRSAFHYAPYYVFLKGDNYTPYNCFPIGESDIYTQIPDQQTLLDMDRISLLTLLGAYNNV